MSDTIDPKIELQIQKGIRQFEDTLVTAIQEALDTSEYPTAGRYELKESQFRNLVRVANTTESAEVVKNFLRYQVGRELKWGRGEKSLAERIIRDVDGALRQQASHIADQAGDEKSHSRIWMELIRRYLGYGSRHLKYLIMLREA